MSNLSILIPVFNYDIRTLVLQLHEQCEQLGILYEILCYDDGSKLEYKKKNRHLNELPRVRYLELRHNMGRAAIRNTLAQEARYENLLFLDNDSEIPSTNFVSNYLNQAANYDVLIGGTIYSEHKPPVSLMLRWKYGRAKEQRSPAERNINPFRSITLNNMFIRKKVYLRYRLDEGILHYGHEDTKFGLVIQKAGVRLLHIDNPVLHMGLEPADVFLSKTKQAIANLFQLFVYEGIGTETSLIKTYQQLKKLGLHKSYIRLFTKMRKKVMKNLRSSNPSLICYNLYKLYLFALFDTTSVGPDKTLTPMVNPTKPKSPAPDHF